MHSKTRNLLGVTAIAAGALLVGGLVGAAAASPSPEAAAQPAPTPAPTVTVDAVDPTCQAVAQEVMGILQSTVDEVVIPQNSIAQGLIDAMLNRDTDALRDLTIRTNQVTDVLNDQTERVQAISRDYEACLNG